MKELRFSGQYKKDAKRFRNQPKKNLAKKHSLFIHY